MSKSPINRRKFIGQSAAMSVAAATAAAPSIATAKGKKFRWRMVMVVPKTLPIWGPAMERFAENVKTLSDGRLRIKVYGAGELVPALGTFEAVKKGEVQMGHSAAYYWQGKIPATPFFTSVPFGMTTGGINSWIAHGGGQQLWDELMAPHGVICMPCGNPGYQTTGWFNRKINTIADLKGLKIRIPGLASKIYAKAGATPVLLAGGEVFTSLATGVIDAVEWVGPYQDYVMGFHKAAKYFYGGSWHEPGSVLELMINKEAWDSLPADLQLLVKVCAAETDRWMHTEWGKENGVYLKKILDEGKIEVLDMPIPVLKEFKKYSDEIIAEMARTSPLATKIHKSFLAFKRDYEGYQDWSELNYLKAFKS